MGKYSRFLVGLVVVGLLASVLVVSVAFADEPKPQAWPQTLAGDFVGKLAKALGKTDEEVNGAIKQAQREIVEEALRQGRISQEQADKALERLEKGGLFAGLPWQHKQVPPRAKQMIATGSVHRFAAEFLGLPPRELLKGLRDGKSLAELAQEQGKTREELKTAIADSTKQGLDKLVANGKLTQQRADNMLQRLQDNLDEVIDQARQKPANVRKRI